MQKNIFGVIIFLGLFSYGSTQAGNNSLFCYNCNPSSTTAAACANPVSNVPYVNCSTYAVGNISNWRFSCYAEFNNFNNVSGNTAVNNRTGIYRGCVMYAAANQNNNWCSRMLEANATRPSCQECGTSGCNTHTFNTGGGISGGGGSGGGGGGSGGGGSGGGTGGGGGGGGGGAATIIPSVLVLILCIVSSHVRNHY